MTKGNRSSKRHAGRVTLAPCDVLGGERHCEPLNRVWLIDHELTVSKAYGSCTCGRRFSLSRRSVPPGAIDVLSSDSYPVHPLTVEEVGRVVDSLWPESQEAVFAKVGVVPVGTEVLHRETRFVDAGASESIGQLEGRLLRTMEAARGIGLAANQVGAPVRMLAHNLPKVAPPVILNPVMFEATGNWDYEEGCLSLQLDGVRASVRRPRKISCVGRLPDGGFIALEADELLSRVMQHELDHLDGIEYVQRLVGSSRDRVYAAMIAGGVQTDWLPFRPYS